MQKQSHKITTVRIHSPANGTSSLSGIYQKVFIQTTCNMVMHISLSNCNFTIPEVALSVVHEVDEDADEAAAAAGAGVVDDAACGPGVLVGVVADSKPVWEDQTSVVD